ncbi:MAG: hypothetical protein JRC99_07295 [Deltaproteobacteria bacterium]|nr:hypothetical protein [Deltaproteobacteria bacterium]
MGEIAKTITKKQEVKSGNLVSHIRHSERSQSIKSPIDKILHLQRTIGNQAVQRLIKSGVLQAKLRIGQPRDKYEQEAERVADAVMRMPEPQVRRQLEPEDEEEEILQAKERPREVREDTPAVAQKVIDIIGEQKWISLVELRQKSAGNDEIVIVELLRDLQPRLVHVGAKEEVGVPSKHPLHLGKIATTCHYTTKLVVNGLRSLGIAAKYRNTNEILPHGSVFRGHGFPVFPTIGMGLSHGDDLYSRPVKDPGEILYPIDRIVDYWKQQHDIAEKAKKRLVEKLMGGGTSKEKENKEDIIAEASWAEGVDIEVPAGTPEKSIVVTAKEVLVSAPAPLVVGLNEKYPELKLEELFIGVGLKQTLRWIRKNIKRSRSPSVVRAFQEYLPKRLLEPHFQLPKNRSDAIEVVINILRKRVVRRPMLEAALKETPSPAALEGGGSK